MSGAGDGPEDAAGAEHGRERPYPPPADFALFLGSLIGNAWISLGKFAHPETGEQRFDEAWARYYIDLLGLLEERTEGNLEDQERRMLETNLSSLRLTFVEEQRGAGGSPPAEGGEAGQQAT
ncbi:MAG: DUF1844 domain-containing protein [Planctomycetota bacterium]